MTPNVFLVTPGDPKGIGPEIVWKAIRSHHSTWKKTNPILCVGARAPFDRLKATVIIADPKDLTPPKSAKPFVWLLPAPTHLPKTHSKKLLAGFQAGWSIEKAASLIQERKATALITGPIHKERLQLGGYLFQGHTDFLAHLTETKELTMMLANSQLRVSLVTVHCGLGQVSVRLTRSALARAITHTENALRSHWGIKKPTIAVLALNPHAGESGIFGQEEIQVITPEILRRNKIRKNSVTGPHPADTFFANYIHQKSKKRPDAVIAMYHDQGLIPVKMLDFAHTVNISLGLPWVRTSVDHGTAFDIAGKNLADPSSFISAVEVARQMVKKSRKKNHEN